MLQIIKDKEYTEWIAELSHRYRQSQIRASVRVNFQHPIETKLE